MRRREGKRKKKKFSPNYFLVLHVPVAAKGREGERKSFCHRACRLSSVPSPSPQVEGEGKERRKGDDRYLV